MKFEMKSFSCEEKISDVDRSIDGAEELFRERKDSYPDLRLVDDLVLLASLIDPQKLDDVSRRKHSVFTPDKEIIGQTIHENDVVHRIFTRYVSRNYMLELNSELILDGVFGRLVYNPGHEEYKHRLRCLDKLIEEDVEFPKAFGEDLVNDQDVIIKAIYNLVQSEDPEEQKARRLGGYSA